MAEMAVGREALLSAKAEEMSKSGEMGLDSA